MITLDQRCSKMNVPENHVDNEGPHFENHWVALNHLGWINKKVRKE